MSSLPLIIDAGTDMFSFFEMTPDLVCIAGKDGYFREVNPAVVTTFGYTKEELFVSPISHLIHPDDKEITRHRREQLLKGKNLLNFRNRYIAKNGDIIWLEWTSTYLPDKEVVFAIAKNITLRKAAELKAEQEYERFKNLAAHFKNALEADRKYIAAELHEELAQMASVVKLDIDWITTNEPGLKNDSLERFKHAGAVCSLLVHAIRRMSFFMSPNMIEDLGLTATIQRYCEEFGLIHHVSCTMTGECEESTLTTVTKFDIFRICQDALGYTAQQNAKDIRVHLQHATYQMKISIQFSKTSKNVLRDDYKLMQEKINALNGALEMQTSEEETVIRVSIPV